MYSLNKTGLIIQLKRNSSQPQPRYPSVFLYSPCDLRHTPYTYACFITNGTNMFDSVSTTPFLPCEQSPLTPSIEDHQSQCCATIQIESSSNPLNPSDAGENSNPLSSLPWQYPLSPRRAIDRASPRRATNRIKPTYQRLAFGSKTWQRLVLPHGIGMAVECGESWIGFENGWTLYIHNKLFRARTENNARAEVAMAHLSLL